MNCDSENPSTLNSSVIEETEGLMISPKPVRKARSLGGIIVGAIVLVSLGVVAWMGSDKPVAGIAETTNPRELIPAIKYAGWRPRTKDGRRGACRRPKQPSYESRADSFEDCKDFCEQISWCKAIEWKKSSASGDNCEIFEDKPETVNPDSNYECWVYNGLRRELEGLPEAVVAARNPREFESLSETTVAATAQRRMRKSLPEELEDLVYDGPGYIGGPDVPIPPIPSPSPGTPGLPIGPLPPPTAREGWTEQTKNGNGGSCRKPKLPRIEVGVLSLELCQDLCVKIGWCEGIEWKASSTTENNCKIFELAPKTVKPDSDSECWTYTGSRRQLSPNDKTGTATDVALTPRKMSGWDNIPNMRWYERTRNGNSGACRKPRVPYIELRTPNLAECWILCEKIGWCQAIEWRIESTTEDNCEIYEDLPRTVEQKSNYQCWTYINITP